MTDYEIQEIAMSCEAWSGWETVVVPALDTMPLEQLWMLAGIFTVRRKRHFAEAVADYAFAVSAADQFSQPRPSVHKIIWNMEEVAADALVSAIVGDSEDLNAADR